MVILDHIQVLFFLQALEGFYDNFDADFITVRTKAREVLQREDDLNEIVQVKNILTFYKLLLVDVSYNLHYR
jgi:hypothetical protein